MARRKSRSKPRRSTQKTINIAGVLEAGMIANAVTTGMFNTNLKTFLTETSGVEGESRALHLNQITLRELIAGVTGTGAGFGTTTQMAQTTMGGGRTSYTTICESFGQTIKDNLKDNGFNMVSSLVLIPVGFRVFSKLTRKPRSIANKAAKMSGLPVRV